jgi:hypothetical protein
MSFHFKEKRIKAANAWMKGLVLDVLIDIHKPPGYATNVRTHQGFGREDYLAQQFSKRLCLWLV